MSEYYLRTEMQARRELKAAFLAVEPMAGAEFRITRMVWSELHGRFFVTVRFQGRDYSRNFPPAATTAGEEVAAVAEGVVAEVRASTPGLTPQRL